MTTVPETGEQSNSKRRSIQFLNLAGNISNIWSLVLARVLSNLDCITGFFKQTSGQVVCAFIINM